MSTPSGQKIVPAAQEDTQIVPMDEAQLMPMDVNGADQSETVAAVPRVEEPAEGSSIAGVMPCLGVRDALPKASHMQGTPCWLL